MNFFIIQNNLTLTDFLQLSPSERQRSHSILVQQFNSNSIASGLKYGISTKDGSIGGSILVIIIELELPKRM